MTPFGSRIAHHAEALAEAADLVEGAARGLRLERSAFGRWAAEAEALNGQQQELQRLDVGLWGYQRC